MSFNQDFLPFHNLSDVDFHNALEDSHQFPLSVINNLKFDKFNFDDSSNDYVLREPVCDYYFCDEFIRQKVTSSTLKLLSFNIASVPLHFDAFVDQLLDNSDLDFDVIGLCETRLNDGISSLYKHSNFTSFFNNKDTHGGGVAIYLNNKFKVFCWITLL